MAEVNEEIEAMLNALGDKTPEGAKGGDVEDDLDKDKDQDQDKDQDKDSDKDNDGDEDKDEDKDKDQDSDQDKDKDKDDDKDKDKSEDEDEEETDKDKIIENLRKQINEGPAPIKKEEPVKKEELVEKEEPIKEEPLKLDDQDFIGDLDLEDLIRDKIAFNKLLNSLYSKGVTDSKRIATEGVLRSLSDIIKHNLNLLTTLKEASDKFYSDNKDLAPFRRVVASVFEEVAAANPDKKHSDIMKLVGPEARKRLELHKTAVKKEEVDKGVRLPSKKSGQRQTIPKPDTSSLSAEIEQMNSILRR